MAVLGELEREDKAESWTEMASRWIGLAGAVTSGDEKAVKVASDAAVAAVTPSVVTSFCQLPRLPTLRPLRLTRQMITSFCPLPRLPTLRPLRLTRQMIELFTAAVAHRDGFFAAIPRLALVSRSSPPPARGQARRPQCTADAFALWP
jgi:hypothetical protein